MKNQMQCILEYIAIALMVLNIVGYALHKSISCIALFGAGAYIARCFSKNLTINIFAGLLVSNVFFGCSSLKEGWNPVSGLKGYAEAKLEQTQNKITNGVVKEVTAKMDKAKALANAAEAKAENTAKAAKDKVKAAKAKAENTANAAEAKAENTANAAGFANRENLKNPALEYSLY